VTLNRRTVLQGLGGSLFASQLSFLPRLALSATPGSYQALVCIFLYGGNDSNNTVIPLDAKNYGLYKQWRGSIALTAGNGDAPIPLGSTTYGLHPSLPKTASLWNTGDVGIVFNVGTLVDQTLTVAGYQANPTGPSVPDNLFSHEDQRNEWKSAISKGSSNTGWGGRIADTLAYSGDGLVPPLLSFAGPDLFTLGAQDAPLCLPATGPFLLKPYLGKTYRSIVDSLATTLANPAQTPYADEATTAVQTSTTAGIAASGLLNPVLTGANSVIDGFFSPLSTSISQQLWSVAKIIADNAALGAQAQVFYTDLGNFDTHQNELVVQAELLGELDDAVYAFYQAMAALGLTKNVTTFTLSDFSRTYVPNTTGGTDHAWGSDMFVYGGSVIPQSLVGQMPALNPFVSGQPVGPLDVGNEGRWLPQISVVQFGATLASWLGVSAKNLPTVFPSIANFNPQNLGFLNPAP
jgi:uncharacterized protein (DUF1501 family)